MERGKYNTNTNLSSIEKNKNNKMRCPSLPSLYLTLSVRDVIGNGSLRF